MQDEEPHITTALKQAIMRGLRATERHEERRLKDMEESLSATAKKVESEVPAAAATANALRTITESLDGALTSIGDKLSGGHTPVANKDYLTGELARQQLRLEGTAAMQLLEIAELLRKPLAKVSQRSA